MSRCLSSAYVTPNNLKRCIREEGHPEREDHLWVEATTVEGTALVVRWKSDSKKPTETLIACTRDVMENLVEEE